MMKRKELTSPDMALVGDFLVAGFLDGFCRSIIWHWRMKMKMTSCTHDYRKGFNIFIGWIFDWSRGRLWVGIEILDLVLRVDDDAPGHPSFQSFRMLGPATQARDWELQMRAILCPFLWEWRVICLMRGFVDVVGSKSRRIWLRSCAECDVWHDK